MKLSFNRDGKTYIIRPASSTDVIQVTELINICSQELYGRDEMNPDELENDWRLEGFDLEKDSLLILQESTLVGYADIWRVVPPFVRFDTMIQVHPDFRGMGFGWLLNVWAESRAQELMQKAQEGLRVFLSSYVNARDQEAVKLLNEFGSKIERYSLIMERDLNGIIEGPSLPDGFSIRMARQDEYPDVYKLQRECFRDHWGFIEVPLEKGYQLFQANYINDPFFQPELWFVIEHDGDLVGLIIGTSVTSYGEDYGWIGSLGVLREYRKLGLGKALLLQAFNVLQLLGSTKVGLSVDAQSLTGATKLYQNVGMTIVEKFIRFEKTLREGLDLRTTRIGE
ncbi:MAG: GNAT family N-acetyltransferase [Anaerolineaceae bacterium]